MVSLDCLSWSARRQNSKAWARQFVAATLAALAGACDEYTCLDYANCSVPDAGVPAQRNRDAGADLAEAGEQSELGLDAGRLDSSTGATRSSEANVDGGIEPNPTPDAAPQTDGLPVTSEGSGSQTSSDFDVSSDNLSADGGADAHNTDACASVSCGEHAACRQDGEGYLCECQRGFVGDGLVCQPAVFDVSAGLKHSCALVGDGRVRCWGNDSGALGLALGANATTFDTPASQFPDVDLGGAPAVSISAGGTFTCTVLSDGRVRCWGKNDGGQLGLVDIDALGDDESPNLPDYDVDFGAELPVSQVAAGASHACALFESGKVRCWGLGSSGQLGNGSTENWGGTAERSVAKQADVRLTGRAVQITAGGQHSCALLESGQVVCWGDNGAGQLGLGNTINMGDNETALEAVNLGPNTRALQIGAGNVHTCALLDGGAVRCWGANGDGQCGLGIDSTSGDAPPSSSDLDVKLGAIDVVRLSVGGNHSCVIYGDGKVRCWGLNYYGELGNGSAIYAGNSPDTLPTSSSYDAIVGDGLQVAQVAQNFYHTCALLTNGAVRCWGDGGNCGYGRDENGWLGVIGKGAEPYPTPASAGNVPVF